jgi:alkyl hydroperoxide reductase subunit AhpC
MLRLTSAYPRSCGRNFDEILRTIDSLQRTDSHGVATPAHWRAGDDVIIPPSIADEEARDLFPRGWHEIKP